MKRAALVLLSALLMPLFSYADTLTQYNGSCDDNVNVGTNQGIGQGFLLPDSDFGYQLDSITVRGAKGTLGTCTYITFNLYDGDYTSSASNIIASTTVACSSLAEYSTSPSLSLEIPIDATTTPNETDYFYRIIASGGVSNDGYRHCMDNTSPGYGTTNAYWYSPSSWTSWSTKDDNFIITGYELTGEEEPATTTASTTDDIGDQGIITGLAFLLFVISFYMGIIIFRISI